MVSARLAPVIFFLWHRSSSVPGLSDSARLVALTVRPCNQQMAALPVVGFQAHVTIPVCQQRGGRQEARIHACLASSEQTPFSQASFAFSGEGFSVNSPCYPGTSFVNTADLELTKILLPLPPECASLALVFMLSLVALMSFCLRQVCADGWTAEKGTSELKAPSQASLLLLLFGFGFLTHKGFSIWLELYIP